MTYHALNTDHAGKDKRIKCSCGNRTFCTPEPPTDRFFTGRFWCAECGSRWNTQNIVQRLAFVPVERVA